MKQIRWEVAFLLPVSIEVANSWSISNQSSKKYRPPRPLTNAFDGDNVDITISSQRRSLISFFLGVPSLFSVVNSCPAEASAFLIDKPSPSSITTVILESPETKIGVQLGDIAIGDKSYPFVKSVSRDGVAFKEGVQEGMVVVQGSSASSVVQKIKSGPYPLPLQFYDVGNSSTFRLSPIESLQQLQQQESTNRQAPQVSSRGAGLSTKTIRKAPSTSNCQVKPKRGDQVTIAYEARVASPGGPIYDSSDERGKPVTFRLGEGQAIAGVESAIGGMCVGEIKSADIPAGLGYGRSGSNVFDIPGDVRLWWKIELLELNKRK